MIRKKVSEKFQIGIAIPWFYLYNIKAFRMDADFPQVALLTDGLGRKEDAFQRNRTKNLEEIKCLSYP